MMMGATKRLRPWHHAMHLHTYHLVLVALLIPVLAGCLGSAGRESFSPWQALEGTWEFSLDFRCTGERSSAFPDEWSIQVDIQEDGSAAARLVGLDPERRAAASMIHEVHRIGERIDPPAVAFQTAGERWELGLDSGKESGQLHLLAEGYICPSTLTDKAATWKAAWAPKSVRIVTYDPTE